MHMKLPDPGSSVQSAFGSQGSLSQSSSGTISTKTKIGEERVEGRVTKRTQP